MKIKFLFLFLFASTMLYANDIVDFWGQTGHRVVGEIASNHLTKKAKRNLEKLLGPEGLAMLSTYADEIKSDKKYDQFKPWHYINMSDEETYANSKKNPKGDLVIGIKKCQEVISNPTSSKEDKVFYLKLLVHLVGDLHQPMHIGRKEDLGGNKFKVKWFYKFANLHSVWDSKMIDSYGMSYSELSSNLDKFTKNQIAAIQQGSVIDWVDETKKITNKLYASADQGKNLSYRYMYDHFGTVKTQLQKGGLRLAMILNELFG